MAAKAAESLRQSPPDTQAAVGYLEYAHNYYPSGTKQVRGSRLDRIVERSRSLAELRIIQMLRVVTGQELGDDAELWIQKFGGGTDTQRTTADSGVDAGTSSLAVLTGDHLGIDRELPAGSWIWCLLLHRLPTVRRRRGLPGTPSLVVQAAGALVY
jgi:hypothetical protein